MVLFLQTPDNISTNVHHLFASGATQTNGVNA